jgi:hypothetical protein
VQLPEEDQGFRLPAPVRYHLILNEKRINEKLSGNEV